MGYYPLIMTNIAVENHHAINGKIHDQWSFSIAMFNYQRVTLQGVVDLTLVARFD